MLEKQIAAIQKESLKEIEAEGNDFLSYEKIRWPCYKDMVLTRKYQMYLPQNPRGIKKMLGLVRAPYIPLRNAEGAHQRNDSSAKNRRVDSASSSKSKGRSGVGPSLAINA